jgi:hypothetical protein
LAVGLLPRSLRPARPCVQPPGSRSPNNLFHAPPRPGQMIGFVPDDPHPALPPSPIRWAKGISRSRERRTFSPNSRWRRGRNVRCVFGNTSGGIGRMVSRKRKTCHRDFLSWGRG